LSPDTIHDIGAPGIAAAAVPVVPVAVVVLPAVVVVLDAGSTRAFVS
jgi:hypothetical protein